jgi:peptidoglycan/LPS O-acetylase OafA/YrhL
MQNLKNKHSGKDLYTKFMLMLSASFVAMYITMYLNTFSMDHVYFSLTRFYMTCLGISAMALIMLFFMRAMYKNKKKNIAIILGSIGLFAISLFLVRAQKPIEDVLWMKAMIPHHSIAILTSGRAEIKDPEVKKLAEEIIRAQEREIEQMKEMILRLEDQ